MWILQPEIRLVYRDTGATARGICLDHPIKSMDTPVIATCHNHWPICRDCRLPDLQKAHQHIKAILKTRPQIQKTAWIRKANLHSTDSLRIDSYLLGPRASLLWRLTKISQPGDTWLSLCSAQSPHASENTAYSSVTKTQARMIQQSNIPIRSLGEQMWCQWKHTAESTIANN